jgi:hypothetical protein
MYVKQSSLEKQEGLAISEDGFCPSDEDMGNAYSADWPQKGTRNAKIKRWASRLWFRAKG